MTLEQKNAIERFLNMDIQIGESPTIGFQIVEMYRKMCSALPLGCQLRTEAEELIKQLEW